MVPPLAENPVETRQSSLFRLRRQGRIGWGDVVAVVIFLGIALFAYWQVWTASAPSVIAPGGLDSQLNMWFLSWTPFALLHGHNPFFSTYGNYPFGVNLLTDTGEPLLGLLAAPLTLLLGPIISFNVMLALAMASSATACYALARRFTTWRPAAFFAGLLYGFSPYMIGQGVYHLNLLFVPLLPLMFLVLHELLVVQKGRPERWGALLAALVCAQFFVSSEVLAEAAVVGVVAVVILVLLHPAEVRTRVPHAAVGLAVAVAISAFVLIGPILYSLHGPGHVNGPINPYPAQVNRADLLGAIVPNHNQRFAPASLTNIGNHFAANPPENGSYLGLPLLLVLAVSTVLLRRVALVTFCAVMVVVTYVLSLGSRLIVSGSPPDALNTGVRLPGVLFDHIPLLDNAEPARLSLFVVLFASVIFAVAIDRVRHAAPDILGWSGPSARHAPTRRARPIGGAVLAVAIGIGALVPLVPSWPYPATAVDTPAYFTSDDVRAVPADSVALLYPYPDAAVDDALPMLWQASANMRFKTPGGYFLVPQASTGLTSEGRTTLTGSTLADLYNGVTVPRSPTLRAQLRQQLATWKVHTILAAPVGTNPGAAISFLSWLVGRGPVSSGGMDVWYHVQTGRGSS